MASLTGATCSGVKGRITVGANQGASVQEAYIPADRVEDFIAGERELLK